MLKARRIFPQITIQLSLFACIAIYPLHAEVIPQKVQTRIAHLFQGNVPDMVGESSIRGIYEVRLKSKIYYIDESGEFLLDGKLIDLRTMQNLTEASLREYRQGVLDKIDRRSWIAFSPPKKKYTLYVFTDVDCHFCRKFHLHINELMDLGIEVRYLFAPFQGKDAYDRAIGVWCSANRREALTRAKKGRDVPLRQCDNPIEQHLAIVKEFGISGTPSILLSNGTMINGYVEPKELLKRMQLAGIQPRN